MGDLLRMADAAWCPPGLPMAVQGLAGYLRSLGPLGPLHAWTSDDWAHAARMLSGAGGGFLLPIYLPGQGEHPTDAARFAVSQCRQLGQPPGTLIMLDREAGRGDLDASWCWAFHDGVVGQGYVPGGYTSESTATVFAGWSVRWIARPGPAVLGPGDQMTQYAGDVPAGGGTVDLSVVARGLPLWQVGPSPIHGAVREETMQMCYSPQGQLTICGEAVDNGDLLVFTEVAPGRWTVGDVTEGIHNAAPTDPREYRIH